MKHEKRDELKGQIDDSASVSRYRAIAIQLLIESEKITDEDWADAMAKAVNQTTDR